MRNILILGVVTTLGACGGLPPDGTLPSAESSATLAAPAPGLAPGSATTITQPGGLTTVPGAALVVRRRAAGARLVGQELAPIQRPSADELHHAGALEPVLPVNPTEPSGSDPMPARGDDDGKGTAGGTDKQKGTGAETSGSSEGGSGGTGLGGTAPGQGTDTGTSPGGEGKSDPMPADDTRRN